MRGGGYFYSIAQLAVWNIFEGRYNHRYFPANILKLFRIPILLVV